MRTTHGPGGGGRPRLRRRAGAVLLALAVGLGAPATAAAPDGPDGRGAAEVAGAPAAAAPAGDVRVSLDCPGREEALAPAAAWNTGTPYYVANGTVTGLVPGHTYLLDQSRPGSGITGPPVGAADSTGLLTLRQVRAARAAVRLGEPLPLQLYDTTDGTPQPGNAVIIMSRPVGPVSPLCARLTPGPDDPVGTEALDRLVAGDGVHALVQQADGNLVLYRAGRALWHSGTYGSPGSRTVLQDDGNLVVYSAAGRALWQSQTYGRPQPPSSYGLVVQTDGNVVLYGTDPVRGRVALWHTGTYRR